MAANECIARLMEPRVPSQIGNFLRSCWRDVVQARIWQAGEDSAPTKVALQTVCWLIWALRPKHDPGERKRHAAALPGLLKKLNAGFDEIGTSPTERKTFMDTLVEMQLAALRAEKQKPPTDEDQPAPGEKPPARDAGPTLQVTHATESGVRVQDISLPAPTCSTRKTPRTAPTCAACASWCAATGSISSRRDKTAASA